ncbi:MAG: glutamate racemase, partial [Chitinophagaceae bacterium]
NTANKQLPIGVFDSGTGGLTILEAIVSLDAFNNITGKPGADGVKDFEAEYFQYLADQANMPYGNYASVGKTALLQKHMLHNANFFMNKKQLPFTKTSVKALVLACNTATAYTLDTIKSHIKKIDNSIPVFGVINAGAKAAINSLQKQGSGTIGIFATVGTVYSNGYVKALNNLAQELQLKEITTVSQGGFGLAESIDKDLSFINDTAQQIRNQAQYKGPSLTHKEWRIDTSLLPIYQFNNTANNLICSYDSKTGNCNEIQLNQPANYVRYHLVSMIEKMRQEGYQQPLRTLILGCTHYPYMKDTIQAVLSDLKKIVVNGEKRYDAFIGSEVVLIDPAQETAKEVFQAMFQQQLLAKTIKKGSKTNFYITVPAINTPKQHLQADNWFTYSFKYGRNENDEQLFVQYIPFDTKWITTDTYQRIAKALPNTYHLIKKQVSPLP